MQVLPQTPLDWVLLAVEPATAIIIAVAMQDCFVESRTNSPRLRALQDVAIAFAVTHFGVIVLRGSVSANWAIAGIAMYVVATLLFLSALESARRVPMPRTFVVDPLPKALVTSGPLVTLLALVAIGGYVVGARREERQLEDRFGEASRTYKLGTGMLLPPVARLLSGRSPQ